MSDLGLECIKVKAEYPAFKLNLDFSVKKGEFVSIIGPSGSGKSTALSIISGLVQPDGGKITINGRDVSALPPDERKVGMVFQDYALFPHMSVGQNIAYPMKNHHLKKDEINSEVNRYLELVNLPDYAKRKPDELSGGEKQRVALARALASKPEILLLDEPLSALDAKLRKLLRNEIKEIHKKTGTTTLYVTHDQEEAMGMSDRIIILKKGQIEQIGTPEEIYRHPGTLFVASFTGYGNILPYEVLAEGILQVQNFNKDRFVYQHLGQDHMLFFRPEEVMVHEDTKLPFPEFFPHLRFEDAEVVSTEYSGREYLIKCVWNHHEIKAYSKFKPENKSLTLGVRLSSIQEFLNEKALKQ